MGTCMTCNQREMPFFQSLPEPKWLPAYLIDKLTCETDAVLLCWNMRRSKYTIAEAARHLDIPASHLSSIISGKKYLPNGFRPLFQVLCGNWAIRQFEDKDCGFHTVQETPDQRRIRVLESELENARRAA